MRNNEDFDLFPVNILESNGPIERKGFNFQSTGYKIWSEGNIIQQGQESFIILGNISNNTLTVYLRSDKFSKYMNNEIHFRDISSNRDRLLWMNSNEYMPENKKPTALSLFFKNSILSRILFTIDIPQILIEIDGQPSDILQKKTSFINMIQKGKMIDLDNIQRLKFVDETVERNRVKWGGYIYEIVINCIPEQPDMVMIPNYASTKYTVPHIICKDEDFWNDIAAFFSYYHESSDFFSGLYNSVIGTLGEHIEKYGRLVDTDISTISSEFILFTEAIYKVRVFRELQESEKEILFDNSLGFAVEHFGDYIYITKYKMTAYGVEPYLEKMI